MRFFDCHRRWSVVVGVAVMVVAAGGGWAWAAEGSAGTPTVTHGSAGFRRQGADLTVKTGSDRTIIHWDRFGVTAGSITRFDQPNARSATLNRVTGDLPSRIDGQLLSNGSIYLTNANGIVVGSRGRVATGGSFVASTLDLSDGEFLKDRTEAMRFTMAANGNGAVRQLGRVQSRDGDVFLLGYRVVQGGTVSAPKGTAGLAAVGAGDVIIHPAGAEGGRLEIIARPSSFADGDGVRNDVDGIVRAAAVELKAHGDPYRLAVNNLGVVESRGVVKTPEGRVFLSAVGKGATDPAAGAVNQGGTLRAVNADGSGGRVAVSGENITLASGSLVDVSAETGRGGVANIGGEWRGGAELAPAQKRTGVANAQTLTVASGATVRADGAGHRSGDSGTNGDGGTVVLWSDTLTDFAGRVTARGGLLGGDGGLVEVSGKADLRYRGRVDTSAPHGATGTLWLDPKNIVISNSLSSDADTNVIKASDLVDDLALNDMVLSTSEAGGDGITVLDDVVWNNGNSLTLLSHEGVYVRAHLVNGGAGAITLVAGWDGSPYTAGLIPTTTTALGNAGWFGATTGVIEVGAADGGLPVMVGSRSGATTLLGRSVSLVGGDTAGAYAQIGYRSGMISSPPAADAAVGGAIAVYAKEGVTLAGGAADNAYAQIGHGGFFYEDSGTVYQRLDAGGANLTVMAGGALSLTGQGETSRAQVGHGGFLVSAVDTLDAELAATGADLTLTAASLTLRGQGSGQRDALVGHAIGLRDSSTLQWTLPAAGAGGKFLLRTTTGGLSATDDTRLVHGGDAYFALLLKLQPTLDLDWLQLDGHTGAAYLLAESGMSLEAAGTAYTFGGNLLAMAGWDADLGWDEATRTLTPGALATVDADSGNKRNLSVERGLATAAGKSLLLAAGDDLTVKAALTAGGDGFLSAGADLTLDGTGVAVSADQTLLLSAAGKFVNDSDQGADTLAVGAGGRWLVWTGDAANTAPGGLPTSGAASMRQFGVSEPAIAVDANGASTFNPSGVTLTGNGFLMSLTVAPTVTLTADDATMVYGNTPVQGDLTYTVDDSNLILGDTAASVIASLANLAKYIDADNHSNVGDSYTTRITADSSSLGYSLGFVNGVFRVTKRAITITADEASKIYGDANPTFTHTVTGGSVVNGDTATGVLSTDATVLSGKGFYDVTENTLSYGDNYDVTFVGANKLEITKRAITVTADSVSRAYGDANPAFGHTVTSGTVVNGDTATGVLSTDATGSTGVGFYDVKQNTLSYGNNYDVTFVGTNKLEITKRAITVTADAVSRTYGENNPDTFNYTVTGGSVVNDDTATGALSTDATATSNAGRHDIKQGTLSYGDNYAITFVGTNKLTIDKRSITVTANEASKIYGNANPSFTYTVTGGSVVNGDQATGVLSTDATVRSNVGLHAIKQGSLSYGANYDVTFVGADKLEITKRSITVTPNAVSRTYGDANPVFGHTVTGGSVVNGDTATGKLATGATVLSGVGDHDITQGTLSYGNNYTVTFTGGADKLTITRRAITVTADSVSRTYGNNNPAVFGYTVTVGSVVNGDQAVGALTTDATRQSGVGRYAVKKGTLSYGDNYQMTFVGANKLTITQRAITVTADSVSRTYGDSNPAVFNYRVTGGSVVNNDAATGAPTTGATVRSGVGGYDIDQGTLSYGGNYRVTFVGAGKLTITKRAIKITANDARRVYGNANPAFTHVAENVVNGDRPTGGLSTNAAEETGVGQYDIRLGTLDYGGNYTVAQYKKASLTITPRPIRVGADDQSRVYGDANPALGWHLDGGRLVNGDAPTGSLRTSANRRSGVGDYGILVGGLDFGPNYAVTAYTPGTLTVTRRDIAVGADALTRVYGDDNPALTWRLTGGKLVNGDQPLGSLSTSADSGSSVGSYVIGRGTLDFGANYRVTGYASAKLTVTRRPIAVAVDAKSRAYGDANPELTWSVTGGGLANGDLPTGTLATAANKRSPVGEYAIERGSLDFGGNYTVTDFADSRMIVKKRLLTVLADMITRRFGDPNPPLTWTITEGNLVNGDVGSGGLTTDANYWSPTGYYDIGQGSLRFGPDDGRNYAVNFVGQRRLLVQYVPLENITAPGSNNPGGLLDGGRNASEMLAEMLGSLDSATNSVASGANNTPGRNFMSSLLASADLDAMGGGKLWDWMQRVKLDNMDMVLEGATHAVLGVRETFVALQDNIQQLDNNLNRLRPAERVPLLPLRNQAVNQATQNGEKAMRIIVLLTAQLQKLEHTADVARDGVDISTIAGLTRAIDLAGDQLWVSAAQLGQLSKSVRGLSEAKAPPRDRNAMRETAQRLVVDANLAAETMVTQIGVNRRRRDRVHVQLMELRYKQALGMGGNGTTDSLTGGRRLSPGS